MAVDSLRGRVIATSGSASQQRSTPPGTGATAPTTTYTGGAPYTRDGKYFDGCGNAISKMVYDIMKAIIGDANFEQLCTARPGAGLKAPR